ncbi:hypothetical protein HPB48_012607 [Haemaphysalis longicornis]|uniref:Uncharacterized protein n=1 Tax=Haemaphysalis longicornis TaxID=44386 RepID=A0A9J6G070_HAELO|nr:hypothetical protein HPB48_012607 [Haemaphysalis longicornis]
MSASSRCFGSQFVVSQRLGRLYTCWCVLLQTGITYVAVHGSGDEICPLRRYADSAFSDGDDGAAALAENEGGLWSARKNEVLHRLVPPSSGLGDTASTMAHLNSTFVIVVCIAIIVLYTSLGGLASVIYTDMVQLITTILGMWSCLPFLTTSSAVGTIGAPHNYWLGKINNTDISQMVDLFLMTTFGGIPWQVYFQRVLSADSIFTAKMLSYMSAVGCIFFAIPPVIVGGVAKSASTPIVMPVFSMLYYIAQAM